jgi:hypothetical protein
MGHAVFYFWDVHCLVLVFLDAWGKADEEVEWGLSGGCTGPGVVYILGYW